MVRVSASHPLASRALRTALLAVPLAALTACGGGGGGGDGAAAAPVASDLVITSNNAQPVAGEAVEIAVQGNAVADLGGGLATGAQVSTGAAVPGPTLLAGVAGRMLAMAPRTPALATGVTETASATCSGGGTIAMTVTSNSTTGLVTGDALSIDANNCVETVDGSSVRMNGHMGLSVAAGSFNDASTVYPKDVTLRMVVQNFSLNSATLDGSLDLHLVQSSAVASSVSLTAPTLSWRESTASGTQSVTLTSYSHAVGRDGTGAARITVSGTVESSNPRLGTGVLRYRIETPQTIVTNAAGAVTAGTLKVSGSASALQLVTTGVDTFSLQVDGNGDGVYESSRTVTRSQL